MACFWTLPPYTFADFLSFGWDVIKAAVPAGVAWVAYKVSKEAAEATQAQRDIAANQYKISLYEIRAEKIKELKAWMEKTKISEYRPELGQELISLYGDVINLFRTRFDNIVFMINDIDEIDKYHTEKRGGRSKVLIRADLYPSHSINQKRIIDKWSMIKTEVELLFNAISLEMKVPLEPFPQSQEPF